MQDPENLEVWHRSIAVAVTVHLLARSLRPSFVPGLRNQLCRAAASIPANIAEGAGADSPAEFARFLGYAIGSASEVASHLTLASRISPHFRGHEPVLDELKEIRRMLYRLRQHHKRKSHPHRPPPPFPLPPAP